MHRSIEGAYNSPPDVAPLLNEGFDMDGGVQPSFFGDSTPTCDGCGAACGLNTFSWASPGPPPSLLCDPCHEKSLR